MTTKKLLMLLAALFISRAAVSQDTIVIQESGQSDWALGTLDSLTTWSDTLGLDTVRSYHFLFTNCGQTGLSGPSQSSITNAYAGTDLAGAVTGLNGIQQWQTPEGGLFHFKAAGAGHNADSLIRGAVLQADFELSKATGLFILAGQTGASPRGGNGGTFVAFSADTTPLLVAGGAAGMRSYVDAANRGSTATSGQSVSGPGCSAAGGIAGSGGLALGGGNCSGAGGGFYGNGQGCGGGFSFVNGGAGGNTSYAGGFGGGGGVNSASSPGGGGGYSGGSVHYTGGGSSCAGGGGSFIDSTGIHIATSDGYYDNNTTFNGDSIKSLDEWRIGDGYVAADAMRYVESGVRTSPVYDISTPSSFHDTSSVTWNAETFTGTSVTVETRFSTDGGNLWTAWDTVTNGGRVAGLLPGMVMDSARLQTRITLATAARFASPRLFSIAVTVINNPTTTGITDGGVDWSIAGVYPNPFDQQISVSCFLPRQARVGMRLLSILGQSLAERPSTLQQAGYQQLQLTTAGPLPAGMYWLEITLDGKPARKKVMHN